MSDVDAERLARLARAFGLAPRQLALAAARLARDEAADSPRLRAALAAARAPSAAAQNVAALLATPIASFALDDVDRALAALWPAGSDCAFDRVTRNPDASKPQHSLLPLAGPTDGE